MSEIIDRRISFNAGEMSPWLDPRIDLDKYQMGCRQMENLRGSIYGGAVKRNGTTYIGAAKTASTAVRLIPWLGGDGTDYVLEFSNLKLRVWNATTKALVTSTPLPEVTQIYTVADVANSLDQKTFILRGAADATVGFWLDTNGAGTAPAEALACATQVKITLATADTDASVATKVAAVIEAHADFTATASANEIIVTAVATGLRTNASASTSGFTVNPIQKGVTTGATVELTTVYTAAQLEQIQHVQQNDVMYLTHPDHRPQVLLRATDWQIGDANFEWPATLGPNISSTTITPVIAAGVPIPTPAVYSPSVAYTTGQTVSYKGSIYARTSAYSGRIKNVDPLGDAGLLFNQEAWRYWTFIGAIPTPAADGFIYNGQSIGLLASGPLFQAGHVGSTWVINHNKEFADTALGVGPYYNLGPYTSAATYVLGPFTISTKVLWALGTGGGATIRIERSTDMVTWETYTGISIYYANSQQIITGTVEEPQFFRIVLISSTIEFNLLVEISPDSATHSGMVTITAVTDSKNATATVTRPLYRPLATTLWEEPAFSAVRGYPRAVTLHDGRLWFGGTIHRPTSVWGSTVDAYWDYRLGPEDDRALQYTLAVDESSTVQWLVSQDLLVIGTSSSEWALGQRPGDDAIRLRRNTSFGSIDAQARAISDSVVFIQKSGRKLREFAWSFERDGYLANDLSMLAEHLGDAGMRQIAIQRNPEAVVWIITERGDLLAMTYERSQNVSGWSRMTTAGTFESIAILPGDGEEDIIWLCVVREIDGSTVRYIERVAPDQLRALKAGEVSDLTFSDCAIVVEPAGSATGMRCRLGTSAHKSCDRLAGRCTR